MRKKRAVSPVVATLILIIVAVTAVTAFALLLSGYASQSEKQYSNLQNTKNEDLQVSYLQIYPPSWSTTFITGINISIRNLNTAPSGLVGIEINGNYTGFSSIGDDMYLSPYSVLTNGVYSPINSTQTIPAKETLQLEVNLSLDADQQPIPRTSAIIIGLVTAAENTFTFSIEPPVAQFNVLNEGVNPVDELLNASGSYSADTGIQLYNWNFANLNQGSGVSPPFPTLSGPSVQFFPQTSASLVTLTVVDDYGLVSRDSEIVPSDVEVTSTSTAIATTTVTPPSCSNPSQDVQLFVCPNLNQLEKIREVLMTPYNPGQQQSYGYYQPDQLSCGGNIEPSPAIGISNGYNNVCVITDNNIEGGCALDYFNSANSILSGTPGWTQQNTNICSQVRDYLSSTQGWYGVGGCQAPFTPVYYPSSFSPLYDRREGEYGFIDPYAATLAQPGVHLGGIGNSCGTEGQVYFAEDGNTGQATDIIGYPQPQTTPLIVTEMPGPAIGPNSNLEELSFYIDEAYMQCIAGTASCSLWQTAYQSAMSQYPFQAPRQALHFIQATRATQAWRLTNMTVDGLTPLQMVQIAITQIFTPSTETGPMGVGGATGPDGGLYQAWGGAGSSNTPEPNMQAMIAFDPEMPDWFTPAACSAVVPAITTCATTVTY